MATRTVAVTGAAGMVGSNLVPVLLERGWEVRGIDDLSMGSLDNLASVIDDPSFSLVRADMQELDAYRAVTDGADAVIHLAAKKIPKFGGAKETLLVNSHCAELVLEEASRTGARVLMASTSDVYGMTPHQPCDEDGECVMGSSKVRRWAYAVSKLFDEHLAMAYSVEDGVQVSMLRFFNSYGPNHHRSWWGGPQSVFIDAALCGDTITVHGDGSQRRCFTYASDLVEGIALALECDEVYGDILNLGNPNEDVTIRHLAELICELTDREPNEAIKYVPHEGLFGKYQEVQMRVPDISKARRLLDYDPTVTLREGLKRTIAWHRENPLHEVNETTVHASTPCR